MLSVKARETADTAFKVFGMTQLRIKPSLPCFAGERFNQKATKLAKKFYLWSVNNNKALICLQSADLHHILFKLSTAQVNYHVVVLLYIFETIKIIDLGNLMQLR